MKNNAIIKATFGDLLDILDARTNVYIFEERLGLSGCLRTSTPVYGILTDRAFLKKYSDYAVIGLNKTLGSTSILIKEV